MTINADQLLNWTFEECIQTFTVRDTLFYALSLGVGSDPYNRSHLKFVYEEGLVALPTLPMILGWPGLWFSDPATGIDASAVVNVGQTLIVHSPCPVAATVSAQTRIVAVYDRGAGRGALVHLERLIRDQRTQGPIATVRSALLCRNDGGFGGIAEPARSYEALPARAPDQRVERATLAQAHLLYRLNGDRHPLHVNPDFARSAGFSGPILHGLATFGMVGHALVQAVCGDQPERRRELRARFSAPFFPGETLSIELWQDGARVMFNAWSRERRCKVLDQGYALVALSEPASQPVYPSAEGASPVDQADVSHRFR
ncbi:MAG: MaoC/PaaZ C-terminal domain-containing protein [Betaproteobacteria bacterium]